MSYIKKESPKIGSYIKLNKDIESLKGRLTKGSIVKITNITERGFDVVDEDGNQMIECGWNIGNEISVNLPTKYFGYVELYLEVQFENGKYATAKNSCDFSKPEGLKDMMNAFYFAVYDFYKNSNIKSIEFISKERYEELDSETEETCKVKWDENHIEVHSAKN